MRADTKYKVSISWNTFIIIVCLYNSAIILKDLMCDPSRVVTAYAIFIFSMLTIMLLSIVTLKDVKKLLEMKKNGLSFCEFCNGKGYKYETFKNKVGNTKTIRKELRSCNPCRGSGKIDWIQKARGSS